MSRYSLLGGLVCLAALVVGALEVSAVGPRPAPLVTATYQVADLVVPVDTRPVRVVVSESEAAAAAVPRQAPKTTEKRLIERLTAACQPQTWEANGGKGTAEYFPRTLSLVVRQTPAVQREVAQALKALRDEQETQVAVELRVLRVSDRTWEKLCGGGKFNRPAVLSEAELGKMLEAALGDRNTNVLQAPKVTLMKAQRRLEYRLDNAAGEQVKVDVKQAISADRQFVRLDLGVGNGGSAMEKATWALPSGQTVLMPGWESVREVRREYGAPPVIDRIPYLNRLFKGVGISRVNERTVVLVTPRVIAAEAEEQKAPAVANPK